jgi:hypothetical protein
VVLIFFYIGEEKLLRKNSSFEALRITEYFLTFLNLLEESKQHEFEVSY